MITVTCPECGASFHGRSISGVMNDRRDHMEQRHLPAKIETDT